MFSVRWFSLLCLLGIPTSALADGLRFSFTEAPTYGEEKPCVMLQAPRSVAKAVLTVSEGRRRKSFRTRLPAGSTRRLCWNDSPGVHHYTAKLTYPGGSNSFEFQVAYFPPLEVDIREQDVDLVNRTVHFRANQPVDEVELMLYAPSGRLAGQRSFNIGRRATTQRAGRGATQRISWGKDAGPVGRLQLKITSVSGRWIVREAMPWRIEVPHREVNFSSGSAAIAQGERPKLDEALQDIREAAKKSPLENIKLYVAGFTDTVGRTEDNRKLSMQRARALASYFKRHGLSLPVYFRGYGEEALAVRTADGQDERQNRRALYILSQEEPSLSTSVTWGSWQRAK